MAVMSTYKGNGNWWHYSGDVEARRRVWLLRNRDGEYLCKQTLRAAGEKWGSRRDAARMDLNSADARRGAGYSLAIEHEDGTTITQ